MKCIFKNYIYLIVLNFYFCIVRLIYLFRETLEINVHYLHHWASLVAQTINNPPAMWETWIGPLCWKYPVEEGMATDSVFLPGESHGQGRLVSYSPQGHKESNVTERLSTAHLHNYMYTNDRIKLYIHQQHFLIPLELHFGLQLKKSSCCCMVCSLCATLSCFSHVSLFAAPWTVAHQAPLSMESSQPGDGTHISYVSCIGKWFLYHYATWETLVQFSGIS